MEPNFVPRWLILCFLVSFVATFVGVLWALTGNRNSGYLFFGGSFGILSSFLTIWVRDVMHERSKNQ